MTTIKCPLTRERHEQRLRLKRLAISALSHAMLLGILALALTLNLLTDLSLAVYSFFALSALVSQSLFWQMFSRGWNLKCRDPSLTLHQIASAMIWFSLLISYLPEIRGSLMLLYIMVMLFGIFQLSMLEFAFIGLFSLFCFGAVLLSDLVLRPDSLNLKLSLMQWLILASAQTWIALFASYVRRLSERLKKQRHVLQHNNHKMHKANKELEKAMVQLNEIASTDELTGILTRRRFFEAARSQLADSDLRQASALCMIDLDHFKAINDRFGHQTGDQVLERFCQLAQSCLRSSDLFGRYGGEEFVLLLPKTNQDSAVQIAERIRLVFAGYAFDALEPGLTLSISVGVTLHRPGESLEQGLKRADKALYQAKTSGRNRTHYQGTATAPVADDPVSGSAAPDR